jgi:hypothetical protein
VSAVRTRHRPPSCFALTRFAGFATLPDAKQDAVSALTTREVTPHIKYVPWKLVAYVAFTERAKAEAFERYQKAGSGHAFANRHLR